MKGQKSQLVLRVCGILLLGGTSVVSTACAVELIDSILAERGVTECSSTSGGEGDDTTGSSTSSGDSSSGTTSLGSSTSSESTDTTSAGTWSGTTGSPPAVCGDGIVEGEEACDDGNETPGDGCQDCAKDSIVFVSSEVYQGFALDGLYGADQRCRALAAKAGLRQFLTFKAWLSTPTMPAAERMVHSRGRYVLVNGLVVAQNWDALISGTLENPIAVDENSQTQDWGVWTGTFATGQPALGSDFCEEWSDDSGLLIFGGTGLSAATDAAWSFFDQGPCDSELRLYCVQQ